MWPALLLVVPPDAGSGERSAITAPTDVGEWDDDYIVKMDVPGFTEEDVTVSVSGNTLRVATETRERDSSDVEYHHRERDCRPVERELELPMEVDAEAMTARIDDGVLTIHLPKDFTNLGE